MNFGENLKRLRKEKGLSQEQLAERLNISRQAISKWESNNSYPEIDNLIELRNIFNISLDDLIILDKEAGKLNSESEIKDSIINNKEIEADDEISDNLAIGGFLIGTAIGLITENFIFGTVGAFLGIGVGYIINYFKNGLLIKKT